MLGDAFVAITKKNTVSVIGSTGCVGTCAINVIALNPELFQVNFLVAKNNIKKLLEQAKIVKPKILIIENENLYSELNKLVNIVFTSDYKPEVLAGKLSVCNLIENNLNETILLSSSGTESIYYLLSLLKTTKNIALANKESIVCGGDFIKNKIKSFKGTLLPVDSEHSALYQCLLGNNKKDIEKLIITASGGSLLNHTDEELNNVSIKAATTHPNWNMSPKITVDSSTMINKCLELIEASYLFDINFDKIDIVLHPKSILHAAISYKDGTLISNLYNPSMNVPVAYALYYPNRIKTGIQYLDLIKLKSLEFLPLLERHQKIINLTKEVIKAGNNYPCVFNTANELLVNAFLLGKIKFLDIIHMLQWFIDNVKICTINNIDELLNTYNDTKAFVQQKIDKRLS